MPQTLQGSLYPSPPSLRLLSSGVGWGEWAGACPGALACSQDCLSLSLWVPCPRTQGPAFSATPPQHRPQKKQERPPGTAPPRRSPAHNCCSSPRTQPGHTHAVSVHDRAEAESGVRQVRTALLDGPGPASPAHARVSPSPTPRFHSEVLLSHQSSQGTAAPRCPHRGLQSTPRGALPSLREPLPRPALVSPWEVPAPAPARVMAPAPETGGIAPAGCR